MSKGRHERSSFGIIVYEGVEPIDVGATFGVLSMAKRVLPNLTMHIVAERAGLVELAGGLRIMADYGFAQCPALDVLIVCGGPGWRTQTESPAIMAFLRRPQDGIVASVCTGAMILAAAGVLDGRAATTRRHAVGSESAAPLDLLRREHPEIRAVEAPVVDADHIVTGGGVSLAIDATLHLLKRLYGQDAATEVAGVIEYTTAWRANETAFASRNGANHA
jgi:transcriptional regulator GlxA family with amidase domain